MSESRAAASRPLLLQQAAQAAVKHLEGVEQRAVAPTAAALDALALLPAEVPRTGRDGREVIAQLASVGGPAMHGSGGGRYFGFVTGGTLPVALAADWLAAAWDQNGWNEATSPGAAALECKAVAGLLSVLGLPTAAEGVLCSGATGANIIALAAARDTVLGAAGWDVEADGLVGAPPIKIYAGAEAHSSVFKALGVVGLGRRGNGKHVIRLAANPQGAVEASAFSGLPPPAAPAIVVLQAGHVNTGAFDDFVAAVAWARSGAGGGAGIWVHVDGAFGLWAAASGDPARRALVAGAGGADSWATDLHKMLNVPYESALVAVMNGQALHRSMACAAPYVAAPTATASGRTTASAGPNTIDTGSDTETGISAMSEPTNRLGGAAPQQQQQRQRQHNRQYHHHATQPLLPELQNSRRARGVAAWAALQQLGIAGVAALVDGCCDHAAALAGFLERGGATLLHTVVFNQALVHFSGDDARTAAVAAAAQLDGRCWVAATKYKGRSVIRLSVSCWATTSNDVEVAARAILECAASLGDTTPLYSTAHGHGS